MVTCAAIALWHACTLRFMLRPTNKSLEVRKGSNKRKGCWMQHSHEKFVGARKVIPTHFPLLNLHSKLLFVLFTMTGVRDAEVGM
mmetsp:Transcript_398/g.729  ORF Transcript_398/g.729 Transcript_398/m.729 type:complete len:85 (+) Transcript_398:410-664(+)